MSCPSATFCAAVDSDGAVTYNGTSWSALTNIDGGGGVPGLDSVSCPSATFCAAADEKGNALTYNGTSWTVPTKIAGTKIPDNAGMLKPFSVSCPSATFCAAVDSNSTALTYNGTSWTAPTKIDGVGGFQWFPVSCSSATFCAAVGGDDALTYTTATAPKDTALPIIKGKDKEKSKLTASNGIWTGTAPSAYKYQWEVCNAKAKKCQAIKGATKSTFTITSKYVGSRMEVAVTATNSVGSAKVLSKATPVIEK